MTNQEIGQAIAHLRPGSQYAIGGDDYAELVWLDTQNAPPTLKEITDTIKLLPAIQAAEEKAHKDSKDALLAKLGITDNEAKLLLS